jgi:hypothetical protein
MQISWESNTILEHGICGRAIKSGEAQHLVNQTKTGDNEIVQTHGFPPLEVAIHSEDIP